MSKNNYLLCICNYFGLYRRSDPPLVRRQEKLLDKPKYIKSMQKCLQRISQIDRLLRFKKTGTADDFARKLCISRSTLFEMFSLMKDFGAEIAYCPHRQTYYYTQEGRFEIGFKPKNKLSADEMEKISGGYKKYFAQSDIIGHLPFMFATVNKIVDHQFTELNILSNF